MFSRTAEELLANLKGLPHRFFFAHGLPIPDCFESPVQAALSDPDVTHVWMVEDDMILPQNALKTLLAAEVPVATYDYPVSKAGQGVVFRNKKKEVIYCGTGCLLIERKVFDKLEPPYFRTDIRWTALNYGEFIKLLATPTTKGIEGYGLHDVTFGIKLWRANIPISVLYSTLGQRKLKALGKAGSNNGAHKIEDWTKVKKDFMLKQLKKAPPLPHGNLVTVITPTGEVEATASHAKRLQEAGLGILAPSTGVVIDDIGVTL